LRPAVERIRTFAALDLGVLADDGVALGIGEGRDSLALRLKTKPRSTLALGRNAMVGDGGAWLAGHFDRLRQTDGGQLVAQMRRPSNARSRCGEENSMALLDGLVGISPGSRRIVAPHQREVFAMSGPLKQ